MLQDETPVKIPLLILSEGRVFSVEHFPCHAGKYLHTLFDVLISRCRIIEADRVAYFAFCDRESISGNYSDLVVSYSLCAEFVHIAVFGKVAPNEQSALRLMVCDFL
jgi:hypothetical protein